MQTTVLPSLPAVSFALNFPVVSSESYPRMRLSGDGSLVPSALLSSKRFLYVSSFLNSHCFPDNPKLCAWDDELVFFPIRRVSRVTKVLEKLALRAPTYHHAVAFGLRIEKSPVGGPVFFPHKGVLIPEHGGPCFTAFTLIDGSRYAVVPLPVIALSAPVWAVGVR